MDRFDFHPTTRIVSGAGCIEQLGALAAEMFSDSGGGGERTALLVSDSGVVSAGHFETGRKSLEGAGWRVASFHDFRENPHSDHVAQGVQVARQVRPELIVGLGGGSSMDCAKGINFVYSCGGKIQDYWGTGKATCDLLPMIAVPTTSGTGSETQSYALISDAVTHVKMACGDRRAAFRIALLDPELTVTMPPRVTALTGIDALSHAIETFVTKRRNPLSMMLSLQAFRSLAIGFPQVLREPGDLESRRAMQWGACLAGWAIEQSMLGAAHALANPLTASFGIVHGQAVGAMLPHVIRFNARHCDGDYAMLVREMEGFDDGMRADGISAGGERLARGVLGWLEQAGLSRSLGALGVPRDALDGLAADAAKQWTGTFNPIAMTADDFLRVYQAAFD
jgi:alcohol dehydrogenase